MARDARSGTLVVGLPEVSVDTDQLGVLSSTAFAVEASRYVRIDDGAIAALAPGLARRLRVPDWSGQYHFNDGSERTVNWLLALDAVNFSFWGEPRWTIEYRGETLDGYKALAASLTRAVEETFPIYDAEYLADISMRDAAHIFRGSAPIPMLDRRVEHWHEVGEVLLAQYDGSFARAVESRGGSAVGLVRLLVDRFVSFGDVADLRGREIRFYKRAQLLVTDLYGAFQGDRWGHFTDLDQLTACADYKLPQMLRHLGILRYIPSLAEKVDNRFLLPQASREEIEIRAATIWAVERLRQELARHGGTLRAFELDWWLWHESQRLGPSDRPYHRVRSPYY